MPGGKETRKGGADPDKARRPGEIFLGVRVLTDLRAEGRAVYMGLLAGQGQKGLYSVVLIFFFNLSVVVFAQKVVLFPLVCRPSFCWAGFALLLASLSR